MLSIYYKDGAMLEKFKKLDVILLLLILLALNSVREINLAQSIVALGIFGLVAYNRWMDHLKKPDFIKELRDELDHVKNNMSGIMVKNATKPTQNQPNEIKRFF